MVIVEKSFPRGGVAQSAPTAEKKESIVFGATQIKKKSESKQNAKKSPDEVLPDEEERIEVASAGLVTYQSLQDGMVIMGIVKSVDQIKVTIGLPGRMAVKVSALSISDSYTKNVREFVQNSENAENYKPLTEMYEVGKIVYGKVMEVTETENGRIDVNFSLKPTDVHSELVHSSIKKGFVFNGAIEEVQEHGYIVETGIKSLRCFLPIEKSQPGHAVGELVFMKVEELKQQPSATTIRCKEVKTSHLKIKDQIEPNLDYLLPGAIVNFTVTKCLKDGLQGTLMNGTFTGYVNEHNLLEPLASLEDVEVNSVLSARILYVAPLTKFVYLSLNLFDGDDQSTVYQRGNIVQKAAIHHVGNGGVVVILDNKYKGVISLKAIKSNQMGNFDMDQILNKYTKKSKCTVRILDYDLVGKLYICTDDPAVVNEKVFTTSDISLGDIITATVTGKDKKLGGYSLQIGKLKGAIERLYLSPTTIGLSENSKLKCRVLTISPDRNFVYVTNLPEYMSQDCNLLTSIEDAKVNGVFLGTIVKCEDRYFLVKFFNNIKGILYRTKVNGVASLYEGQTMHFRVVSHKDETIVLGLPEDSFEIGEFCVATVTHVMDSALEMLLQSKQNDSYGLKAIVPDRLLSEFSELATAKLKTYSIGQELTACCISKNVFSIRDVPYFKEGATDWKNVKVGDILRSFIKNVEGDVIEIVVPIKGYPRVVKVHRNMMLMQQVYQSFVVMMPEQPIYVKVLGKEVSTRTITVSAKMTDVWDGDLTTTAEYFEKYLIEILAMKKVLKKQKKPIGQVTLGDKVSASYKGLDEETGDWMMEVDKHSLVGCIKKSGLGYRKPPMDGESMECVIIWIDYANEVVYLSCDTNAVKRISTDTKIPPNMVNKTGVNARIMLRTDNALVCSLKKGVNPLAFIPTRLNYNDFEAGSTNGAKEGDFCKLSFIHERLPIAVLDETHKFWHKMDTYKRKIEENMKSQPPAKKLKISSKKQPAVEAAAEPEMFYEDRVPSIEDAVSPPTIRKRKQIDGPVTLQKKTKPPTKEKPAEASEIKVRTEKKKPTSLPGAVDFWSTEISSAKKPSDSSSDEDEDADNTSEDPTKKKKKQSTAEKYKAAREEETRLREIEEKYANPNILPETSDQFDRLVLSEPNESKNWINYMVFHLQAMEIDKARAVARRALKAISFREDDELMNIWVALLNLELRYGTKESFNDVLKESLLSCDQFRIYMRVLEILTEANKTQELVELIGTVTKKFKDKLDMWKCCAIAFYKAGIHDRAQQMMHKALAVLPEREHVNTIVAFANLTHKYSKTPETAHTLLDQVVTSYPKRVDVWSQLIDMLIKDNQVESARRTLERAVIQKIPLKKMRTIFKKYMEFEERHGTPEDVEKVKELAASYVKNNSS